MIVVLDPTDSFEPLVRVRRLICDINVCTRSDGIQILGRRRAAIGNALRIVTRDTDPIRRCQLQPAVQEPIKMDRDVSYGLDALSDRAGVQLDQGVPTQPPPTWPSPAAERHTRRSPIEMLKL